MLKRMTKRVALLTVSAMLALAVTGVHAADGIQVDLNGKPLKFTNTLPMQIKGSTLVPMRDIFEALGASVKFDKASQTVYGQKGETAIILPLGALIATVNGQPHTLPQPAQLINGTTLVPLRFISEALGAAVAWNPATSTVTIQTVDEHVASLPTPPGTGPVSGQVTGVYDNTTPTQITLMSGGRNTVMPLAAGTIILRSVAGQPAMQVPLKEIRPGDQVTVQRDSNGVATLVSANFGEVSGTIVGIGKLANGNSAVTLDSGRIVELSPDAPITFAGRAVKISDLKPYEKVVIRTNPANSLGYGMAVETAINPNPTPPNPIQPPPIPANPLPPGAVTTVTVDSFTQDASKPLKAGDVLTATLNGTPGGKASFAIPGVAENVPMQEVSPGVYRGTYTVLQNASVAHAAVLGKLVASGVTSALIQAPGRVTIDSKPPVITELGPGRQVTVETEHPLIYATFSDPGSGVNPAATRITLDGKIVTNEANVTASLFTYKPVQPLASGPHRVGIIVYDKAGNLTSIGWIFQVSTSKVIQSFTTNEPAGRSVGAGQTVVLTLNAQPGGKATASVGGVAKDIPMQETAPGVYTGEYSVKAGDSVQNAPVSARFIASDGTTVTTDLPVGLTLDAGPPPAPRILSPPDGATVSADDPLTVTGKAAAGSTIHVSVNYTSKTLGGFLPVSGESGSKDVLADKNGHWTADGLSLKIQSLFGSNRDTVFTISASELDAGGNPVSSAASVQVRPG